jgi:hypothetical protein
MATAPPQWTGGDDDEAGGGKLLQFSSARHSYICILLSVSEILSTEHLSTASPLT